MKQEKSRETLIAALAPFARLATLLDGNEFENLYEFNCNQGHVKITMKDLKNAQRALGLRNARSGEPVD